MVTMGCSVDADWIVKYIRDRKATICSVKYHICIISEHCDLQTNISHCLGDIISCPQITLPAEAHYPCI